jgi:L-idonate 5-dehydrogenase
MEAYVLHGPRDLRRETREEPTVGSRDVKVRIKRIGICGSDIHYYEHYRIGDFIPQKPLVLGHEFAGEVAEVGSDVVSIHVGDRVTAEPSIECGHCRYCRQGRYNLCENLKFIGTAATVPHIDGAFGTYVVVPESHCYPLHDDLDWGAGALAEPLAVGMNAVRRVGQVAGARILITGGGTIGQMTLASALALGATDITVADPSPFAQDFSRAHGAQAAVDPRDSGLAESMFGAGGFDVVFEASGSADALAFAYRAAAKGARIVQIGTLPPLVTLPANLVMSRELTVLGTLRYAHVFPIVLEMMRTGRVAVQEMISKVFDYSAMNDAMDLAAGRTGAIKVQVACE